VVVVGGGDIPETRYTITEGSYSRQVARGSML